MTPWDGVSQQLHPRSQGAADEEAQGTVFNPQSSSDGDFWGFMPFAGEVRCLQVLEEGGQGWAWCHHHLGVGQAQP